MFTARLSGTERGLLKILFKKGSEYFERDWRKVKGCKRRTWS